ncbi:hypothetical protein CEXT_457461 [Caerostris extrusa]|uniref:Uncharacterized protein n=1 Tax=Caerostris extrusa TaxID=172846 RepID=A0AAV4VII3_CAEEX|nr:hypothetical protein CEXT_457461 [Caerostris extrusa]
MGKKTFSPLSQPEGKGNTVLTRRLFRESQTPAFEACTFRHSFLTKRSLCPSPFPGNYPVMWKLRISSSIVHIKRRKEYIHIRS